MNSVISVDHFTERSADAEKPKIKYRKQRCDGSRYTNRRIMRYGCDTIDDDHRKPDAESDNNNIQTRTACQRGERLGTSIGVRCKRRLANSARGLRQRKLTSGSNNCTRELLVWVARTAFQIVLPEMHVVISPGASAIYIYIYIYDELINGRLFKVFTLPLVAGYVAVALVRKRLTQLRCRNYVPVPKDTSRT